MAKSAKASQNNNVTHVLGVLITVVALVFLGTGVVTYKVHTSITNQVQAELFAQKIFFPPSGSPMFSPEDFPDIQQYAGQQVDTPEEAQAYADGFIKRHLQKIGGGKVYSEVSAAAMQDPTNPQLQAQSQALFQGETLRGLLLSTGYAFGTVGKVAKTIAVVEFVGSGMLLGVAVYLLRSKK